MSQGDATALSSVLEWSRAPNQPYLRGEACEPGKVGRGWRGTEGKPSKPKVSACVTASATLRTISTLPATRSGLRRHTFRADLRTVYAVTRCLEIISEASRRLPDEMKARRPSIAWRDMAGAGNVYRHNYEDVAASYVWVTVQNHLRPLRVVIERELAGLG